MSEVRARATITVTYPTPEEAQRIHGALAVDDDAHLTSGVQGPQLVVNAVGDSPQGLLRALEDFLACLQLAEKVGRTR